MNHLQIFLDNDNSISNWKLRVYFQIIENAQNRILEADSYFERHHILPKSIWKEYTTDVDNIVNLLPKEHFICHLLLWKMFKKGSPEYYKMAKAVSCMIMGGNGMRYTSNLYAYFKLNFKHTEETKTKMSLAAKGKPKSKEHKNSISKIQKDTILCIREDNTGKILRINKNEKIPKGYKKYKREKYSKLLSEMKWINNGVIGSRIHKDERIPEGWVYGRLGEGTTLGRKTINNGKRNKIVPHEELPEYLKNGWVLGMVPQSKRKNPKTKGMKYMNNSIQNIKVNPSDIDEYISDGWVLGMKKREPR